MKWNDVSKSHHFDIWDKLLKYQNGHLAKLVLFKTSSYAIVIS